MSDGPDDRPTKKLKTSAASAFFTKVSERPKSALSWHVRHENILLHGKYRACDLKVASSSNDAPKIAAFDLDGTLIATKSGNRFARDESDWRFFDKDVPKRLQELYKTGHHIVIFTNQAGFKLTESAKRYAQFKAKLDAITKILNVPLLLYAATGHDVFRKPRPGMFQELNRDLKALDDDTTPEGVKIKMEDSFFVGDAAGRSGTTNGPLKKSVTDHSSSDRKFAQNINFKFFTPEEFFLSAKPQEFVIDGFDPSTYKDPIKKDHLFERLAAQEIVLFVGSPAAGKSSYYSTFLKPLGYTRINQDTLKTRQNCLAAAKTALAEGKSVCVDNTNANIETRSHWISLAREADNVPVRVVFFTADVTLCQHNNAVRAFNPKPNEEKRELLPAVAFTSWTSRYQKPAMEEGFSDIKEVEFLFRGTDEERNVWRQYWA